jgi:hypothetical protein
MSDEIFDLARHGTKRAHHKAAFLRVMGMPATPTDAETEKNVECTDRDRDLADPRRGQSLFE